MSNEVRYGAATHMGLRRTTQEDGYLASAPLFAVADGMGGHAAGEVASSVALEVIEREAVGGGELGPAFDSANRTILERAAADGTLTGMGTTLTAVVAGDSRIQIAHVGDSRAYLLRGGELRRLTKDHTVVGRMVRMGRITERQAQLHPARSQLERALGVTDELEMDLEGIDAQPGDRLLLCTDGLNALIEDEAIREVLVSIEDPQLASEMLVAAAVDAGGIDNVTVLVVDYPGGGSPSATPLEGRRTRRLRLLAFALAFAATLATVLAFGRVAIDRKFFVGVSGDRVAIFRGVPEPFAGMRFTRLDEKTEIPVAELPLPVREHVEEGIPASDRADAREIIENLETLRKRGKAR